MRRLLTLAGVAAAIGLGAGASGSPQIASWSYQNGGGTRIIGDQVSLSLRIAAQSESPGPTLFEDLLLDESDVGKTFAATAATDPDFGDFAAFLTNGQDDVVTYSAGVVGGGFGSRDGHESNLYGGQLGSVDAAGIAIDGVELRVDALSLASPGSDPNHDGNWTDYELDVTVSLVPEAEDPEGLGAALAVLGGLRCARRRV